MMLKKKVWMAVVATGLGLTGSPGPALAATSGPQTFTVVKIGTDTGTVIAQGVITGVGQEENNRSEVPRGAPLQVEFTFPEGKVFQTITRVGPPEVDFNPTTCLARISIFDTTEITGGTGAYAGVSGSGVATVRITVLRGRNADGSCLPATAPPIFELTQVQAPGTISVP